MYKRKDYMTKVKKDLLERMAHLPTTTLGFIIVLIGLGLVGFEKITMDQFTGFMVVALPFFFYKKEKNVKDEPKDSE